MNRHNHNRNDRNEHNKRQNSYSGTEKMGRTKGSHFSSEDYDHDMEDNSSSYSNYASASPHRENRDQYRGQSNYDTQDRYSPDHMQSSSYQPSNSSMTRSQDFTERQFGRDYSMGSMPQQDRYGQQDRYAQQGNYGQQDRYTQQGNYGQQDRYTPQASYGQQDRQQHSNYSQSSGQMKGQMTGRGPKGYRRSDERIREDVCDALSHHGGIDATEVEVKVSEGTVTLSGTVSSRQMKRMIEDASESISGIQDVKNEIKVQSSMNRSENQDLSSSMANAGEKTSQSNKGSSAQTDKPGKH